MDDLLAMIDCFKGEDRKKAIEIALKAIEIYKDKVVNHEKGL
mgnify:CR=1 FL=1